MMQCDDRSDPASGQSRHEPQPPKRAGPVQERGHEVLGEPQQRLIARRRHLDVSHVPLDRERRVVDPQRPASQRPGAVNDVGPLDQLVARAASDWTNMRRSGVAFGPWTICCGRRSRHHICAASLTRS
jgi:hypothetical protein